jgi:segregation and condensation protein B
VLTPINAPPTASRLSAYDPGPRWLARPSTYGSFIHDTCACSLALSGTPSQQRATRRSSLADELWDDRAEQDAEQLVGLLFFAAEPLKQTEIAEALGIRPARLARACEVLRADPPRGLRLEEDSDRLGMVAAPVCTATIERYLGTGPPEALSSAALEALAIVAYEQPVTRAYIRSIRGVDSGAVIETLMAYKLVAEDPRFGGRGRPSFLVTTPEFLRRFGLTSLGALPPRPTPKTTAMAYARFAPLSARVSSQG